MEHGGQRRQAERRVTELAQALALLARRDEAVALYDERFCRMWEFYLAACEVGFRYGGLMVLQVQLAKRVHVVPLTRSYVGAREAALAEKEGKGSWPRMVAAE